MSQIFWFLFPTGFAVRAILIVAGVSVFAVYGLVISAIPAVGIPLPFMGIVGVSPGVRPRDGPVNSLPEPVGNLASNQVRFLQTLCSSALAAEKQTGYPAVVFLAIPANETAWGVAYRDFNMYGIKTGGGWTGPSFWSPTWEEIGGVKVPAVAQFRSYSSYAESMEDFARFLEENRRYTRALANFRDTRDPFVLVQGIHQAGYATDSNWTNQISAIIRRISTYVQDGCGTPDSSDNPILNAAMQYKGVTYFFGGNDPFGRGIDCSALIVLALKPFNLDFGRTAQLQYFNTATFRVPAGQPLRKGDILFFERTDESQNDWIKHVGIYMGDNQMFNALKEGVPVGPTPLTQWWRERLVGASRLSVG